MKRLTVKAAVTLVVGLLSVPVSGQSQPSVEQILTALNSSSLQQRYEAVREVNRSPVLKADQQIGRALIAELRRVNAEQFARPELTHAIVPPNLLRALRTMVEEARLGEVSRAAMLALASEAIERPDNDLVLLGAIELAVALRDPEVVSQVQAIAQDLGEIYRRGVQDHELAELIQRRAAEAFEKLR